MKSAKWGRPKRVPERLYGLMLDAWGLAIGFSAIVGAVLAIVLPEAVTQDVVTQELGEVMRNLFTLVYGVSGSFIVYGLASRNYAADALGLCILASAVLVRCVLIVSVAGWAGVYAIPTLVAIALACIARAAVVSRLVEPRREGEP